MTIPTGTIAFLFTDIEGRSPLWDQTPRQMLQAHARHNALLRQCIEPQEGYIFADGGDGFCVAFSTVGQALEAAIAIQRAILPEIWPENCTIKVRLGIHVGTAEEREGNYYGATLSRVARLMSIGHGGQILLSQTAYALLSAQPRLLPECLDMGKHILTGLEAPEQVYQAVLPDLPASFRPLRSKQNIPNNIPYATTSFIGRQTVIAQLREALTSTRLLTLSGPIGSGKTRIALQLASDLLADASSADYADGIWFVPLESITEASDLVVTIQKTLGIHDPLHRDDLNLLASSLRFKRLLLILDNCEHLLEVCTETIQKLVGASQTLKALIVSQHALGIPGERIFPIASLSLPDQEDHDFESLRGYEALQLFIERAEFVNPDFQCTARNIEKIATICRALDGIPLAIELAAAQCSLFSPEEIAAQLMAQPGLMPYSLSAPHERHRTLQAALDWSHHILTPPERLLLIRLSVFEGGITLAGAQAVCSDEHLPPEELRPLLTALRRKSFLMIQEAGEHMRYRLLESVRRYNQRLPEAPQTLPACQQRHLLWCIDLVERLEPLRISGRETWLATLEKDYPNLKAALRYGSEQPEMRERCVEFACRLWQFWGFRGHIKEGLHWLNTLLQGDASLPPALHARALNYVGNLAFVQGDHALAHIRYEESLALRRQVGNTRDVALTLNNLGAVTRIRGNYANSYRFYTESLQLAGAEENDSDVARVLNNLGDLEREQERFESALEYYRKSEALRETLGEELEAAVCQNDRGIALCLMGRLAEAQVCHEESKRVFEKHRDPIGTALACYGLGLVVCAQSRREEARALAQESLRRFEELGDPYHILRALELVARAVALFEQWPFVAQTLGAVAQLRTRLALPLPPCERPAILVLEQQVRTALGEDAFQGLYTHGTRLSWEQILTGAKTLPQ